MFHRRIFVLNFKPEDLPKYLTNEEQDRFHAAIGRMMMYGLYNEQKGDSVGLVTGRIEPGSKEVCCVYHQTVLEYPETWPDGSTKYTGSTANEINDLLSSLDRKAAEKGRPFVMAGIDRGDHWSFHS